MFQGMSGNWKAAASSLAPLVAMVVACSAVSDKSGVAPGSGGSTSAGGTSAGGATTAICGNGMVETGEACDGPVTTTCAALTMGARPVGNVTCVACHIDASGCQSTVGAGGSPVGTGGGPVGGTTSMPGGGFTSSGGSTGASGFTSSGGSTGAGGFTSSGGSVGSGGGVGSGGAAGAGGGSGVLGDVNALRQTCLDTVNQYRAMVGAKPLVRASASVETCSDSGAQQDATAMVAHGSAGK